MKVRNIESYLRIVNTQKTVLIDKRLSDEAYKAKKKSTPAIAWVHLTK